MRERVSWTNAEIRIRPAGSKGRLDILKVHAHKVKLSPTVDLASYAQNLPGWTGAKLAQLMQEAALVAVRNNHESVLPSDMDQAVDRLTIGPKRLGIDLGHQGQCRRAVSEVGIALTSHLLRRHENAKVEYCERISIIPRGQTLSQVVFHRLEDECYMFETRSQLLHRLQVLLGGRAAEEVIFRRDTSKASLKYLEDATCLARKILTIWNLENPMAIHGEPFPWKRKFGFIGPRLDFEGSLYDDYGFIEPPINFDMDDLVARRTEELMHVMYGKTITLLRQHSAALLKTIKKLKHPLHPPATPVGVLDHPPKTLSTSLSIEQSTSSPQHQTRHFPPSIARNRRLLCALPRPPLPPLSIEAATVESSISSHSYLCSDDPSRPSASSTMQNFMRLSASPFFLSPAPLPFLSSLSTCNSCVLLDNKEINGDHIEFIIENYPAEAPLRLVLEEKDPGSLPFFVNSEDRGLVPSPGVLEAIESR
ncbi:ATP-dependent zinc metalloprotease FtsH [Platanthera guangdongensis]|uniref:ATP-dependent zinc metalloprotease FtsH n=1 Tax=Platanthera guangdongensis TaxID=2320717 RepID=A0ABR2LDY9_9ASPA